MEDLLIGRQILKDNASNILESSGGNPNQLELFADSNISEETLKLKNEPSYIKILEEERDKNGFILSVDYLANTETISEVLKVKPISSIDLLDSNNLLYGVCVDKQIHMSNNNKRIYKIFIADSKRRIEIMVFKLEEADRFIIGELYLVDLIIKDRYKPVIFLRHSLRVIDGEYNKFIKNPLYLDIDNDLYLNNVGLSNELIDYLTELKTQADNINKLTFIFRTEGKVGYKIVIKYDNFAYRILTNYFKLKISLK